jgi:hypothetical protein
MKRFVSIVFVVMMAGTFAFANGGSQSGTTAGSASGGPVHITVEVFVNRELALAIAEKIDKDVTVTNIPVKTSVNWSGIKPSGKNCIAH